MRLAVIAGQVFGRRMWIGRRDARSLPGSRSRPGPSSRRLDERGPNQVDSGRFGALNDRRVSEELEGFMPVINESPQGRDRRCGTARAAASGMGSSRRYSAGGLRAADRLATTQEGVCAQESGADRAEHGGISPNVGRLSRLMSLGIVDPQSFAVGVIAGVAATGLFVGFAALLVVGIP